MARDYGKSRSSRQRGSAPHQFLVISVTFLLGYLTASIFDIATISDWMNTQVLAHHELKQEPTKAESRTAQSPPKPKFEFYTLLANEKGNASTQENAKANANATSPRTIEAASTHTLQHASVTKTITTSATASAKPDIARNQQIKTVKVAEGKPLAPIHKGNAVFVIQVAAFKARQDAEHMKGLLTLKGFNVSVVQVSHANGNWFRVIIGPYSNRLLAQKAQVHLAKTERLKGMISSVAG